MPKNQFEFELDGDVVYTGNMLPETLPLSFQEFPDTLIRPIDDIAEIIKNANRPKSRDRWGEDKLINQGKRSSCNAYMAAAMWMRANWLSTGKWVPISPEFVYMHINNGRDAGSHLDKGMVFCTDVGSCKLEIDGEKLIPYQSFNKNQIGMEAMRFATQDAVNQRFGECYQFPNNSVEKCWHAILSCIAGRGVVGLAVHVGSRYMKSGVVCGFDNGPGNHAVCADDIIMLTDRPKSVEDFRINSPQSWGTKFADKGFTQLTYQHIAEPMKYHGLYGVRSVPMSTDDLSTTRIK